MEMIPELYSVICDTYKTMDRTFDVPFDEFTEDSELRDLGIDRQSFRVILMNIESRMNITLPVYDYSDVSDVGDVITMIKSSK